MFGIFGRLKVYLIMFAAFAVFAGVAYWYYQNTQKQIIAYAKNQATLETSIELQKQTTLALQNDLKKANEALVTLTDEFAESRRNVKELETIFNQSKDGTKRDFGEESIKNPEYVQGEINKGSNQVFRCFELLSGQKPMEGDKNEEQYINCINGTTNSNGLQ
jgi:nitrogen fixation/metabolism regulation signal transduction histidine kinase